MKIRVDSDMTQEQYDLMQAICDDCLQSLFKTLAENRLEFEEAQLVVMAQMILNLVRIQGYDAGDMANVTAKMLQAAFSVDVDDLDDIDYSKIANGKLN